jgi:hypothetical protein
MIAPALFETIPWRKHKHIARILLWADTNTIQVETHEHRQFTFEGNYLQDDAILKRVVRKVNEFFRKENTK